MNLSEQSANGNNRLVATGQLDPHSPTTSIQLESGRVVSVPTSLLLEGPSDQRVLANPNPEKIAIAPEEIVIPIIEEQLVVSKRQVALETVRLVKSVEEIPQEAKVDLSQERWDIQRTPMNAEVAERTGVRYEGETAVYPLFEERTLSRKALFLIEEIRVLKIVESHQETVSSTVKRDVLEVERIRP